MLVLDVDTVAETQRLMQEMQDMPDSVIPIKGEDGRLKSIKSIPHYHQLVAQKSLALRFASHFGQTPSARARIVFLGEDGAIEDDPFAV